MPYTGFHERFLEIAEKETRGFTVFDDSELPRGDYSLVEAYCDESGCDCRRVFFNVTSSNGEKVVAVISYGWESHGYYAKWMRSNNAKAIRKLKGPALNFMSRQSKFAPAILRQVELILKDKGYLARIKRHYKLFREAIENDPSRPPPKGLIPWLYDCLRRLAKRSSDPQGARSL